MNSVMELAQKMRIGLKLALLMVLVAGLAAELPAQTLELDSGEDVNIGRGGDASSRVDADLMVYDPNYTQSATWPAFNFNASLSDLELGSGYSTYPGDDGDIELFDGQGNIDIDLNGSTGTIVNSFTGNGIVKAWARVGSDGIVDSCYRCTTSTTESQRLNAGRYEIDFTSLGTDIRDRPWTCSLGNGGTTSETGRSINCVQRNGDTSSVFVNIRNSTGTDTDSPYTIVVY
jgi:hypothetical protein